jgi:hypothetical protein
MAPYWWSGCSNCCRGTRRCTCVCIKLGEPVNDISLIVFALP